MFANGQPQKQERKRFGWAFRSRDAWVCSVCFMLLSWQCNETSQCSLGKEVQWWFQHGLRRYSGYYIHWASFQYSMSHTSERVWECVLTDWLSACVLVLVFPKYCEMGLIVWLQQATFSVRRHGRDYWLAESKCVDVAGMLWATNSPLNCVCKTNYPCSLRPSAISLSNCVCMYVCVCVCSFAVEAAKGKTSVLSSPYVCSEYCGLWKPSSVCPSWRYLCVWLFSPCVVCMSI